MTAIPRLVKLGDVSDVSWGDTKTTKASYREAGFPAYSATGQDGLLDHFDYDVPGVVVSAIGAQCGKTWFAQGQWSCIKNTIRILGIPGISDARYLYFATQTADFFPRRGSAQPFIAQEDARNVLLHLPHLDDQRRIAGVLGALDDLIYVNRCLTTDLTGLCEDLFRQVQDEETSEMKLSEVCDLRYGKALPARDRRPGKYPVVSSAGIIDWHDEAIAPGPGVTLGRKGSVGSVTWVEDDFYPIDTAFYVESSMPMLPTYLLMKGLPFASMNTDSAVPGLNRENALSLSVRVPTQEALGKFMPVAQVLWDAASVLQREARELEAARDELLPLLMSGRVRVKDVAA